MRDGECFLIFLWCSLLCLIFCVCFENMCLGLNVISNISMSLFVGSVVLFFFVNFSLFECSARYGMNNIVILKD